MRCVARAFLFTAFVCTAASSPARTWRIAPDGSGDAPTIQAGFDSAQSGDEVLLAAGVYTWTSQNASGRSMVTLRRDVDLRGESGAEATILDAERRGRGLRCLDVGAIRIEGLTIRQGGAGFAEPYGAGIYATGDSEPTIVSCIIEGNVIGVTDGQGAGIYCDAATIDNCQIRNNSAVADGRGGGLWGGAVRVSNCAFRGNSTQGDGGAAAGAMYSVSAIVTDCTFENNGTGAFQNARGGAIVDSGFLSIQRCTFRNNSVQAQNAHGGAVDALGTAVIEDCLFAGNVVTGTYLGRGRGGAINGSTGLHAARCVFLGNAANAILPDGPGVGGAVHAVDAVVEASTLVGNSGGGSAGVAGIFLQTGGSVRNIIVAYSTAGAPCAGAAGVTWRCCDLFANAGGDAICGSDAGGNFTGDPQFCAADPLASENVAIQSDSPCAAGNHPNDNSCGSIGAAGVNCGSVSVEGRTWTSVKATYR